MIKAIPLGAIYVSAALASPVEDICLTPDVSSLIRNEPFVYEGLIVRVNPVDGGNLAQTFPIRSLAALRVYRDLLGIVRWVPMTGTAALIPQEDTTGTTQLEWVATLNGMGVQPPEAVGLDPDASHGVHQFQLRLRLPARWLARLATPETIGDPVDQIGYAWAWNENKRWDGLGEDDFSNTWVPVWRTGCETFLGPKMFDLVK